MIEKSLAYKILLRILEHLIPPRTRQVFSGTKISRVLFIVMFFGVFFIPRFSMPFLGSAYAFDIRTEDILLAVLLGMILCSDLERPEHHLKSSGPCAVEFYFLLFLITIQISIFAGITIKTLDKPLLSFLYFLKWFEYFCVFFVSKRLIRSAKDCSFYLILFFLLGVVLASYGCIEFLVHRRNYINYFRLYEQLPFYGDANHVGCFFVIWICFFSGLYAFKASIPFKRFLLPALVFVFIPFLGCQSRKSLIALGVSLIAGLIFSAQRKRLLMIIVMLVAAGFFLAPQRALKRFHKQISFSYKTPDRPANNARVAALWTANQGFYSDAEFYTGPDSNKTALYLQTWRWMLRGTEKYFLWGCGLGARHRLVYESQYVLLLSETGLMGLTLFLLLCFSPLKTLGFRDGNDSSLKNGSALGWRMALTGVMVHNITCVSLTVVKIAFPFWFLTALTLQIYSLAAPSLPKNSAVV